MLLDSSGPKIKALLEAFANAWVIFFAGILLINGASFALMNMKQLTPSLVIPWGWVHIVVPINAALMILYSLEHLCVARRAGRAKSRA